jgi:precorrin-6B methylase 2
LKLSLPFILALLTPHGFAADLVEKLEKPPYEVRLEHDRDGIGKFFMGREIAHVMGHPGADWLERPERQEEERPDLLLQAIKVRPGEYIADIGAGTGYFSWRFAKEAGPAGKVYAVDIQKEMLDLLAQKMAVQKTSNVIGVLGTVTNAMLPAGKLDTAIMIDVYHEFSHPWEMLQSIVAGLKPGGRVIFVEYRAEDPEVPIKRVHKMSAAQVKLEAEVHGLKWKETIETLPRQHVIIFQKPL